MMATPYFKVFMVKAKLDIDNAVNNLVQRYYNRLAEYATKPESASQEDNKGGNGKEEEGENIKLSHFEKLSYQEISIVAQYLDHKDVESFRRVNRVANIAACFGIRENIRRFKLLLIPNTQLPA
jgi:uncharacterized protein involved in tellurium resistance